MATYLTTEKKQEIFSEFGGTATNTGSSEAQIALFTYRIQSLSDHLRINKKDHSCRQALLSLVGKRRRLLSYLKKRDTKRYQQVLQELGLRK